MTKVTISRHWNNPEINTSITSEILQIDIKLEDFIYALKQEIGSVTWTFKQETFDKQIDNALAMVLKKVKQETSKVMV